MNKIKLMYDVAKTMKEKEVFIGSLEIGGQKDQIEFFSLNNEFEKNLLSGQVKFKIKTALDLDGKQVKHESSSELTLQNCCGGKHRHLRKHFHHHCDDGDTNCCCTGLKGKLSALMYLLRLIDDLKIEELENKALALSLNIDEIPEELMNHMHGNFQCCMSDEEPQGHHQCMKDLMTMEKPNITFNMRLNEDRAVERIFITIKGKQKDQWDNFHEISLKAELNLKW